MNHPRIKNINIKKGRAQQRNNRRQKEREQLGKSHHSDDCDETHSEILPKIIELHAIDFAKILHYTILLCYSINIYSL